MLFWNIYVRNIRYTYLKFGVSLLYVKKKYQSSKKKIVKSQIPYTNFNFTTSILCLKLIPK